VGAALADTKDIKDAKGNSAMPYLLIFDTRK